MIATFTAKGASTFYYYFFMLEEKNLKRAIGDCLSM